MPATHMCAECGKQFVRYDTIQKLCGVCSIAKAKEDPAKPRKAIKQEGKQAETWRVFRDKVAIPYLDNKYGHICSVRGCSETENLDVDHIKPRGSHPELRLDVKNLRYLCRAHHIERTGVPKWTKKEAA